MTHAQMVRTRPDDRPGTVRTTDYLDQKAALRRGFENGQRPLLLLVVFMVGVFLATGAIFVFQHFTEDPVFDPFGEYPVQIVESRVPGIEGPAVAFGDPVVVRGQKCIDNPDDVQIRGSFEFTAERPAGGTVLVGEGTDVRSPGCPQDFPAASAVHDEGDGEVFVNDVPQEVLDRTRALYAQGVEEVAWRINGQETATAEVLADGTVVRKENGATIQWTTEVFIIAPPDDLAG